MQLILAAASPLVLFVSVISVRMFRRRRDERRWNSAFRDRLTRPAGESLRLGIESLDRKIDDFILGLGIAVILPVFVWAALLELGSHPYLRLLIILVSLSCALWTALALWKTLSLVSVRRRYRQGFDGERLVGQLLGELMYDGYRVFHDVPFGHFNVDHVVVGPAGVFAIETKTRRKRVGLKGNHKVRFDGKRLHWPDGRSDDFGIKNAADRARGLQQWLCSAVGVPVSVSPVLVFPGWMVTSEKVGKVRVLNPKGVKQYIKSEARKKEPFDEQNIRQIVHQLSERVMLSDQEQT